jgi:hypothetical protein
MPMQRFRDSLLAEMRRKLDFSGENRQMADQSDTNLDGGGRKFRTG